MAISLFTLFFLALLLSSSAADPLLDPAEQESLFKVLHSINSAIPWRSLYHDDLCLSSPHGVVCDYFTETDSNDSASMSAHITELSFGYVSDYTPNPPCSVNSTLDPLIFTSFTFLRKLFFYNCFSAAVGAPTTFPNVSSSFPEFGASLEELVLIDNPGLVVPLSSVVSNFTSLRRLVVTGNGVYGHLPEKIGDLVNLEEITLSRNQLTGGVPSTLENLKKLRVLDLSYNSLAGIFPDSIGNLPQLLKLDLSSNSFSGRIPESFVNLKSLEFLDLSFNRFGNYGVPLFIGELPKLREVHLSGNSLGGSIPVEIWKNMGSVSGIGFSNMSLVGGIPATMGLHLKSLCYLGLDNNNLEGQVPEELARLEFVSEINLENNSLTGRLPFPANFTSKIGGKLKLRGNSGLCIDEVGNSSSIELKKLKLCSNDSDYPNAAILGESSSSLTCGIPVSVSYQVMMIMIFWVLHSYHVAF
ncbi:Piriformospora indica-insensitive protein 2 [Linum perenne]